MRRRPSLLACVIAASTVLLSPSVEAQQPQSKRAVGFAVSPRLSNLPVLPPVEKENDPEDPANVKERPIKVVRFEVEGAEGTADQAVQTAAPAVAAPSPLLTFEGLSSDNNLALYGGRILPPDTDGDVGPNHYVQMVNLAYRVFDKAGNPLTPPQKVSSIFAPLGTPCSTTDDGDPIVLYDPLADRWLLSQFCTLTTPFNHQLIAISQTPDPTGAYYLYDFMMPNIKFNDYPKFGVWPDAYYMSDNQFNQAGTAFLGAGVFAFDRAKMLSGDPTAGYIYFDVENGNPDIGGLLPADIDGLNPPAPGTPGLFAYFTADEFGDPSDGLRLFDFQADFATPSNSTFTERSESPVGVAAFDPRTPSGRDDIEQPPPAGSTSFLDAIADRLMFRLAYRNFGTHESLVVNHTVNVSGVAPTTPATYRAGVRYYELRRSGGAGPYSVNEQATFAPADGLERWMGSAAQDNGGNLAVGYSASSLSSVPSIRYAGRLATDPPGGLFQGETIMTVGTGVQTSTSSRWGDYSAMSVDPSDDCTFWYTQEYYTAASQAASAAGWLTRIGVFKFAECTPAASGSIAGTARNAVTLAPIAGATVSTTNGFVRVTGAPGTYSMNVPAGSYDMSASAPGYSSASALGVSVTTGNTTTQDFLLTPMPILMTSGSASLVAEACTPPSGAADPGEDVTVSLCVRNTGTAATVNLVATLLPTGGVTNPGPPQTIGVVPTGGAPVCADFTFTVDASVLCGASVTISVQLQDGASNLGTVTYTLQTGTVNPIATPPVTTSSGSISVPIPDVSTVDIPITVTGNAAIADVDVALRLNHTFDGDLDISLIHPDGTAVLLSNNRGGGGDNFGSGANDCSGTKTVFDDEAASPISSGTAPFAGSFRPDFPLTAFDGKPMAGVWKLRIADTASLDVGTVFCAELRITSRAYICCGVPGTPFPTAAGKTQIAESCAPGNGAADPNETVTVEFSIANAGSDSFGDLVATLLPTGGVAGPSGPQSYGGIPPGGPAVARPFTFAVSGSCGATITATLQLQDGATDYGTISFPIVLGTTVPGSAGPFANAASISIPAGAPGTTSGSASPYPSSIVVSGVTGTVSKVTVKLRSFSHTFPDDVDVLLVGPGGQKILLMSDAGGSPDVAGVTLTFDDAGPALPDSAALTTGTFRPTNFGTGDTFGAPAPAAPYGSALADFNALSPNGTWSLFVSDDAGGDSGSFAGGWDISFQTADPVCCSQPCMVNCQNVTVNNDPGECGAVVQFPYPFQGSCGVVTVTPPSGSFFPVGATPVSVSAANDGSCTFDVTVNDVETPVISGLTVDRSYLWPPNHKMVPIDVNYTVTDNCPTGCTLSVASNELVNGTGDGDTAPDWTVVDANNLELRAERAGTGTGRIYTITVTCSDGTNSSSADVTVQVSHNMTAPKSGSAFKVGTPVTFTGTFRDLPGLTHTATWSFDSLTTSGTVTEPTGTRAGTVRGTYVFKDAGVYAVKLSITNSRGETGSAESVDGVYAVVVIYDPKGGYVTGGGTFSSPAGAYPGNAAEGKVNFGFVSSYFKNATNPKGETTFEFKAGDFRFNALNLEYLAVAGPRAQYKGFGKVNGSAGYNFILTVVDGQAKDGGGVDRFRIKIWDKLRGAVIYDTQPGAAEDADPTLPLDGTSGVSIVSSGK